MAGLPSFEEELAARGLTNCGLRLRRVKRGEEIVDHDVSRRGRLRQDLLAVLRHGYDWVNLLAALPENDEHRLAWPQRERHIHDPILLMKHAARSVRPVSGHQNSGCFPGARKAATVLTGRGWGLATK